MELHEYQAKTLLLPFGLPIPPFRVVRHPVEMHGMQRAVVKAQALTGGRGKAGGVKMAQTPEEINAFTREMLGMRLVTAQTGPAGIVVEAVLLTEPVTIAKEYYVAFTLDRQAGKAVLLASRSGGVEVEAADPAGLLRIEVQRERPLRGYQLYAIAKWLGWESTVRDQGISVLQALRKSFFELDALLLEINPLVLTKEGSLVLLDAKLSVDDNALFRQPAVRACHEGAVLKHDLAYIPLTGTIGCMVNGAGLAMATLDLIRLHGGEPANFLDVGGGASQEAVAYGIELLMEAPHVRGLFVNIFGGIMDCELIARALVSQAVRKPMVVRLEGTNVERARALIHEALPEVHLIDGLDEAARKAVEIVH